MAKKYRDVRRILQRAGWRRLRVEGSHEIWGQCDGRRVVVPAGGKSNHDVPVGTLASIRQSTGIEELR